MGFESVRPSGRFYFFEKFDFSNLFSFLGHISHVRRVWGSVDLTALSNPRFPLQPRPAASPVPFGASRVRAVVRSLDCALSRAISRGISQRCRRIRSRPCRMRARATTRTRLRRRKVRFARGKQWCLGESELQRAILRILRGRTPQRALGMGCSRPTREPPRVRFGDARFAGGAQRPRGRESASTRGRTGRTWVDA